MILFFFKQKTAYEIVDCDWSSDVCSSDLKAGFPIYILIGDPAFESVFLPYLAPVTTQLLIHLGRYFQNVIKTVLHDLGNA